MGYSEVCCHLCGVSFNIGRLRTPEEVQNPPALSPDLLLDLARYTEIALYSSNRCRRMDGCMILKDISLKIPTENAEEYEGEHLPGLNCIHGGGYQGRSISVQEMHGCCTVQCLMPKLSYWQPEIDDQEFEKTEDFFLTGLSDFMPSRDADYPTMFPVRHKCQRPLTDNFFWSADEERMTGMPFHPACLELYKRASLHRSGKVDVQGLMDWFCLEAKYEIYKSFPRSEAVKRAEGQWWVHREGDEHLAANPCFVPSLQKILRIRTRNLADDEDWCCNVYGVEATASFSSKANEKFAE
ncbi:uncharacterized protein ColSpa_12113 [Colletotrichum spaethianum]|uniref:Uncharacterized protein n=1 Tax=Colletotrichum spaethianum TaxID=700344 RepID=A0AA37US42_9PEZI|nr:uncharacterized protein ColSpa_12113 [Colletotrichum spaethianum]GKT51932.1 hypothetical protein ColSpa_12113 [Colletotrichum spaethianum]